MGWTLEQVILLPISLPRAAQIYCLQLQPHGGSCPKLQFPGDKWEQDEMSHLQWDTLWAGSQYPSPAWHRLFLVQVPWTAAALTPGDVFWAGTCGEERKHRAHRHQHSTEIIKQEGEQRQLNVGGWADEIPDPWQSSLNLSSDISSLINPSAVRFPRIFNSQQ